ncbi:hypothetical protein EI94DRAFT_1012870 [Lactarius quietus]|nr:hypothetical protein EI94DRAFT_1012870 [Lactarius quietus]
MSSLERLLPLSPLLSGLLSRLYSSLALCHCGLVDPQCVYRCTASRETVSDTKPHFALGPVSAESTNRWVATSIEHATGVPRPSSCACTGPTNPQHQSWSAGTMTRRVWGGHSPQHPKALLCTVGCTVDVLQTPPRGRITVCYRLGCASLRSRQVAVA